MSNFKNMKFHGKTQEELANIQMKLFSLGYKWNGGKLLIGHLDAPYIYAATNGTFAISRSVKYFKSQINDEYKLVDGELVKVIFDNTASTYRLADKAQHTDDFGNTHTKTFPLAHRPSDDVSMMIAYRSQYKQEQEDKMEYIDLTYTEAWQALKDGKKVLYNKNFCRIDHDGFIEQYPSSFLAIFHPTDKLFKMEKEPEFESLGLSDDCVEIDVFGLKLYERKGLDEIYNVCKDGAVRDFSGRFKGKIKYKGDYTKAKIKVTVDKDGNITYENVA
jgi:hypothetical protein